ncbi:hypothetical protein CERZMDRAFT_121775 [Cercospora zeae-maydis SCOH1-5]|uniref:Protein kinase domain-containing protein n=1 Tax=Cercospora zeae-maydis SCOH1-5 TaxID=717836 RepID=A0A6A6FB59_9PEZI|nr:hypothetical protein CERZMDRAFT_121775 [Cercospora zeae-maydis SCOH1-5]
MSSSPARIDEETLSGYQSSNFYPVKLGDVIRDTYTVRAKLGYGGNSTTWLCTDVKNSFKVLKLSTAGDGDSMEARVLKHLQSCAAESQSPGRYCVRRPEDIFTVSANGNRHQCFIFEPLGPSLLEFVSRRPLRSLHIEEVRWMTIYFLHALDFLHAHDVIHTDLKLDNVQLTLPDNEEEILTSFVAAERESPSMVKTNLDGSPVYMSRVMIQDELTFPILCDLGSAKLGKPPHSGMVQALPYRAPEVILGASWDSKIDIWTQGVLTWELVLGERLFGERSPENALEMMLRYLGPPPSSFLQRCSRRNEYFDEDGESGTGSDPIKLEDRVEMETEIPMFFDFLRNMLRWDPNERLSASQLLRHPWMQIE